MAWNVIIHSTIGVEDYYYHVLKEYVFISRARLHKAYIFLISINSQVGIFISLKNSMQEKCTKNIQI